MRIPVPSWRLFLSVLAAISVAEVGFAVDAIDVDVDEVPLDTIQGANVQAALESIDGLHSGIEMDADVVYVRKDCTGIKNCFTSMESLSGTTDGSLPTHPSAHTDTSWLWGVRQPSESLPLLVDVGPGVWGSFICPDRTDGADFGGVTVRGSGRDTTILEGDAPAIAAIDANNCVGMQFMDLTARSETYGVRWANAGSANWHDMDMIGDGSASGSHGVSTGWSDDCPDTSTRSVHFLYNTRSIARGTRWAKFGYISVCAVTRFFGGEILLEGPLTGSLQNVPFRAALWISNKGADFRAYGTPILVRAPDLANDMNAVGVKIEGTPAQQSIFHLHGGVVAVSASSASGGGHTVNVTGLDATGNTFSHTPGSAWVIQAPDGAATRVSTDAQSIAQVPFHWQSGSSEPVQGLVSQTGSDIYVETDCNSLTSICDGSGISRPHMMIYDASCTPSPWFDIVRNGCRLP